MTLLLLFLVLAVATPLAGWGAWRCVPTGAPVPFKLGATLLAPLCALVALGLLLWYAVWVMLLESWPVSLRHGLDTAYAQDLFARHVDRRVRDVASDIDAWRQWAGPGEHVFFACFRPLSEGLATSIVQAR